MKFVLDASAAVAAVMDIQPNVFEITRDASDILAPDHFVVEVTSGLWKYVTMQGLPVAEALRRFEIASEMIWHYHEIAPLAEEVLREATAHRHPVYDLYYAILARREGAAILTFDNRLKQLCAKLGVPLAEA